MQGYLARLTELGLVNGEHSLLEVDVGIGQCQRFGYPHPGAGKQTKQRLVDDAA